MLELHNLHVQLASAQVLRGLSLSVLPGQMVGLLGRNGAGKTSTMRSIMGIWHCSKAACISRAKT